jgi:hypothetical protein
MQEYSTTFDDAFTIAICAVLCGATLGGYIVRLCYKTRFDELSFCYDCIKIKRPQIEPRQMESSVILPPLSSSSYLTPPPSSLISSDIENQVEETATSTATTTATTTATIEPIISQLQPLEPQKIEHNENIQSLPTYQETTIEQNDELYQVLSPTSEKFEYTLDATLLREQLRQAQIMIKEMRRQRRDIIPLKHKSAEIIEEVKSEV